MVRRSQLRASDADREHVAERLRNAAAEGRLSAEELEHRLGAALCARTYGELGVLVADLPHERAVGPAAGRRPIRLRPATLVALAVLFPIALALTVALVMAVVALFTTWAVAFVVAALLLGPRARALRSPWAVGYRAYHGRRMYSGRRYRAVPGSFSPWL